MSEDLSGFELVSHSFSFDFEFHVTKLLQALRIGINSISYISACADYLFRIRTVRAPIGIQILRRNVKLRIKTIVQRRFWILRILTLPFLKF